MAKSISHNTKYRKACRRAFIVGLCFLFITMGVGISPSHSRQLDSLPAPGQTVALSPAHELPVLKGVRVFPEDPFKFDFLLDPGPADLASQELKTEGQKLISYFLASLTIPDQDLWVNLTPGEEQYVIPREFGLTRMGQDLLAQDYLLKQVTASLLDPEKDAGAAFWSQVYGEAQQRFGSTQIPTEARHKVWIVPQTAHVYIQDDLAIVLESRLRVLYEDDYVQLQDSSASAPVTEEPASSHAGIQASAMKDRLLPLLEQEVNEGAHFAPLRQIYHALILAHWYKQHLRDSVLHQAYVAQNKVPGVDGPDAAF